MSHVTRLWQFLSSLNSLFKLACTHIRWGLDVWFLVGPFVYFHTSYVHTAKTMVRLCRCAGSPEPSLVAYVISTLIAWAGSNGKQCWPWSECPNLSVWKFRIMMEVYLSLSMVGKQTVVAIMVRKKNSVVAIINEPWHDKTNTVAVCPVKTQISLGIHPVWSESSLFIWRNLGSLATHWALSEYFDQTRPTWVFAWRTLILLVLSCCGSFVYKSHVSLTIRPLPKFRKHLGPFR